MSDFSITELLAFQFFLILLNALFACAEIAVISINDNKLKKLADSGCNQAKRLLSLTQQPARFLATIQVGITLAGFLGSAFAADNFSDRIVDWLVDAGVTISPQKLDVLSVIFITLVLSYVTLILGELVPKRLAMQHAEKIALSMSGLVFVIAKIFAPLVWFLTASTNIVLRLLGINPDEKNDKITEEEIFMMLDAGAENGTIRDMEKTLIHNVFEFDNKTAEDVMTHRTDVAFLNLDDEVSDWEKIISDTRFSVYPVFQNSKDNIVGLLNIKDYIKYKNSSKDILIKNALTPPFCIPSSLRIDKLFAQMQKSRCHFAVVIDEYGGVDGVVTMNDLLEEIVGELEDDVSAPQSTPNIIQINKTSWKVKGETPLEEIAPLLDINANDSEYDTFSGFLLSLMEHIPQNKVNFALKYKNFNIKITRAKGHKIEEILVNKIF